MSSTIATHCSVYALSDSTSHELQRKCHHSHDDCCERCQSLDLALQEISSAVYETPFASEDDRDEAMYRVSSATLAIQSWKCHLLRSTHQDQARLDAIQNLDPEAVFIVNDWAMKFLPQRYRESQTDWFGKRGISWHISVVYRRAHEEVQWQGFIHVIQSCAQGSSAVASIMQHVLTTLKKEHPALRKAFFRQDNAGCYHSSRTILACREIAANSGVRVARVDFSDPQGGKGAADRLAATCKGHVRAFINEGNDVCTATDLTSALLSHGGIAGVRVVCLDTIAETPDESQSISGITKLNNFEFSSDGSLTCWRAYGVGKGKTIKPDKPTPGSASMFIEEAFSEGDFRGFSTYKEKEKPTTSPTASLDSVEEQSEDPNSGVYYCLNSSCVRVFLRLSALERHISLEKCTQSPEKYSLMDLAKMGYKEHLEEGFSIQATLQTSPSQEDAFMIPQEGWALKAARKAYRFSNKQKKYLQAKFRIGQITGRKLDAEMVAREMRRARGSDGVRLFQSSEFLTTSQVASFFSRQSALARQKDTQIVDDMDIVASEEESNFSEAKEHGGPNHRASTPISARSV